MSQARSRMALILAIALYLLTLALIPACIVLTEANKAHATIVRPNPIVACQVHGTQTFISTKRGIDYLVPLRVSPDWVRPKYIGYRRLQYVQSPYRNVRYPHRAMTCEVVKVNGIRSMEVVTRDGAVYAIDRPVYTGGE